MSSSEINVTDYFLNSVQLVIPFPKYTLHIQKKKLLAHNSLPSTIKNYFQLFLFLFSLNHTQMSFLHSEYNFSLLFFPLDIMSSVFPHNDPYIEVQNDHF